MISPEYIREPEGPWYVNVIHLQYLHRPYCQSAVDYSRVVMKPDPESVTCAKCLREAENMNEKEKSMLGTI